MATLFKPMDVQVDGNGVSMAGAKLYFYTTGTSTPQDTFSQSDLDPSHVNTNPVVADANGLWPAIYLGTTEYKAILKTAADVTLQTLDPLIVNPQVSTLTTLMDAQFGTTAGSLIERGSSEWDAVTLKAVLDRKFGTVEDTIPRRTASDWAAYIQPLQVVSTITTAVSSGATVMVLDDTKPQSTGEGMEVLSCAITPISATSKLVIDMVVVGSGPAGTMIAALFQDSTADALAAAAQSIGANALATVKFTHIMTSGTTSATTFKVRTGSDGAGTFTFNGVTATRVFGGVCASSITITEIPT